MEQVFKEHQLCKLHGPLGPYFDSYATEMCREGYAQQTREVEIRVVADFDRWLARHRLGAQEVTAELFGPFLRARARRRHLTRCDVSALKRLMRLLFESGLFQSQHDQRRHRSNDCKLSLVSICKRSGHSRPERSSVT